MVLDAQLPGAHLPPSLIARLIEATNDEQEFNDDEIRRTSIIVYSIALGTVIFDVAEDLIGGIGIESGNALVLNLFHPVRTSTRGGARGGLLSSSRLWPWKWKSGGCWTLIRDPRSELRSSRMDDRVNPWYLMLILGKGSRSEKSKTRQAIYYRGCHPESPNLSKSRQQIRKNPVMGVGRLRAK